MLETFPRKSAGTLDSGGAGPGEVQGFPPDLLAEYGEGPIGLGQLVSEGEGGRRRSSRARPLDTAGRSTHSGDEGMQTGDAKSLADAQRMLNTRRASGVRCTWRWVGIGTSTRDGDGGDGTESRIVGSARAAADRDPSCATRRGVRADISGRERGVDLRWEAVRGSGEQALRQLP